MDDQAFWDSLPGTRSLPATDFRDPPTPEPNMSDSETKKRSMSDLTRRGRCKLQIKSRKALEPNMSDSETTKRLIVKGPAIYFGDEQLVEAVDDGNGLASLEIDGTILQEINAALTQPVACGVVLTEEELNEWDSHRNRLMHESAYAMDTNDPDRHAQLIPRIQTCDNLLARHAQSGDTVAVRREVLETLLREGIDDYWQTLEGPQATIAEAEAALAKGGE